MNIYYVDTVDYGSKANMPKWVNFKVTITNTYWFYDFFEALKFARMFNSYPVISKAGSKWYG